MFKVYMLNKIRLTLAKIVRRNGKQEETEENLMIKLKIMMNLAIGK